MRVFIIGQMRDAADEQGLHWLQRLDQNIIEPLMIHMKLMRDPKSSSIVDFHYVVQTPFDLTDPDIMDGVVAAIDAADIIIADLTDANANVYYETALAHALGKQVITVGDRPQFDMNGQRHIDLKQDITQETLPVAIRKSLIDAIQQAHEEQLSYNTPRNPITNFYGTSLPRASSTVAVADTYFNNFASPLVKSWTEINFERTEHLYPINRKAHENNTNILIDMGRSIADRKALRLHVIIPDRIEYATKGRINTLRGIGRNHLQEFLISAPHRSFTITALFDGNKKFQFYDMPTPLEGLQKTIERRMKSLEIVRDTPEWRERELDEINLFSEALERAIRNSDPIIRDHIKVVRFESRVLSLRREEAKKQTPPSLLWMYDLLVKS